MDREKISKAAQLHDDLKKVKRAIGLMQDANNGTVNIRISGNGAITPSANDKVFGQSIAGGTLVQRGEIITIRVVKEDYED